MLMAGPSHSRGFRDVGCESALPPRTDIGGLTAHDGKVPCADMYLRPNLRLIVSLFERSWLPWG